MWVCGFKPLFEVLQLHSGDYLISRIRGGRERRGETKMERSKVAASERGEGENERRDPGHQCREGFPSLKKKVFVLSQNIKKQKESNPVSLRAADTVELTTRILKSGL